MAYSASGAGGGAAGEGAPLARPPSPAKRRRPAPVTLPPWEYLFATFNDVVFPGPVQRDLDLLAGRDRRRRRPLQRPDPAASSPPAVPRPVRVAALDVDLALLPAPRLRDLPLRLHLHGGDAPDRARGPGLGALRPLPAGAGALPAAAGQGALLLEAEVRPPRIDDPAEARPAAPRLTVEIRRFGVGHRRPERPGRDDGRRLRR